MNPSEVSEVKVVSFYENFVIIILFLNFNCFTPILYMLKQFLYKKKNIVYKQHYRILYFFYFFSKLLFFFS